MMTQDTKDRILRSLYALDADKRHKIMQLASHLMENDDDEMRYEVMVSYLDPDMDKQLDKDFKAMMNSGFAYLYDNEDPKSNVPSKVVLKANGKKKK